MSTQIKMIVRKIEETEGWQVLPDGSKPNKKTVTMEVKNTSDTNDPNYPYSFWSGGTVFPLQTINAEVCNEWKIGDVINITMEKEN